MESIKEELDEKTACPLKEELQVNLKLEPDEWYHSNECDSNKRNSYLQNGKRSNQRNMVTKNVIIERLKFNQLVQKDGQTYEHFIHELRQTARLCDFYFEDEMIRDRFLVGIKDKSVQEKLLNASCFDLEKIIYMCRTYERLNLQNNEQRNCQNGVYYSDLICKGEVYDHSSDSSQDQVVDLLIEQNSESNEVDKAKCMICKIAVENLSDHLLQKHPNWCNICNKEFFKLTSLKKHKKQLHKENMGRLRNVKVRKTKFKTIKFKNRSKNEEKETVDVFQDEKDDGKILNNPQCDICGKIFANRTNLKSHMLSFHCGKFKCNICNREVSNLKRHLRMHSLKRNKNGETQKYKCDICNKVLLSNVKLEKHQLRHVDKKSYQCSFCGKVFLVRSGLQSHERIHTGEKPFLCDICDRTFRRRDELICHKRTHTGEKPFKCKICNKSFGWYNCLVTHRRLHTGEKPHQCTICNKAFIASSQLAKHVTTHTREKKYPCDICNELFINRDRLGKHIKSRHTKPHKCETCHKGFASVHDLDRHKRTKIHVEMEAKMDMLILGS